MDDHLKPIDALLGALDADEYVKFKYGPQLKAARKALDKAIEGSNFPVMSAIAKTEALLAFMKEAAGQQATKSARAPRTAKPSQPTSPPALAPNNGAAGKAR